MCCGLSSFLVALIGALALVSQAAGQGLTTVQDPPAGRPDAIIDLATSEGVNLVKGQWRYSDVKIVEVTSKGVGPDLKPSGASIKTNDYMPHAGTTEFDDSKWEVIEPTTLDVRRSTGKLCFNWYRIKVTIPDKIGSFDPSGSTVAFEVVIDDYAEVWVDGELPRVLGQPGVQMVRGFNLPNRVIITRNAQSGRQIQLAVFGTNGPISGSPDFRESDRNHAKRGSTHEKTESTGRTPGEPSTDRRTPTPR